MPLKSLTDLIAGSSRRNSCFTKDLVTPSTQINLFEHSLGLVSGKTSHLPSFARFAPVLSLPGSGSVQGAIRGGIDHHRWPVVLTLWERTKRHEIRVWFTSILVTLDDLLGLSSNKILCPFSPVSSHLRSSSTHSPRVILCGI